MGWDGAYHWTKKSIVVNETAASLKNNGYAIIKQANTRGGVWFVLEKNSQREIYFAKIQRHGNEFVRKGMTESMGPSDTCCPVSFLELVPCPDSHATAWREKVLAQSSAKKREITPGFIFELYGKVYQALEKIDRSWRVREAGTGQVYRMSPKHYASWKEVSSLEAFLKGVEKYEA